MITLDNVVGLTMALGEAASVSECAVYASFREVNAGDGTWAPNATYAASSGTSGVNVVGSTASPSVKRIVKYVCVHNSDTISHNVLIAVGLGLMARTVLAPSEKLEYTEANGWQVKDVTGAVKVVQSDPTRRRVVLSADVTNNNATANTIADVTGLQFPVQAGKRYRFRFVIDYTAAATGTGSRWSCNGPATTRLNYNSEYSLTATTRTLNTGQTAYGLPAACNATSAATAGNIAIVEGFVTPSADGNVVARFASEVASSAIVAKAGSYVEYEEV